MSPAQSNGKAGPLDTGSDVNLLSNTCNGVGNGHSCCSRGNYSTNCIITDRAFVVDVGLKRGDIEMVTDCVLTNGSCSKRIVPANDRDDSKKIVTDGVLTNGSCSKRIAPANDRDDSKKIVTDGVLTNGSCSKRIVPANDRDDSEAAENNFLSLAGKVDNTSPLLLETEIMLGLLDGMPRDRAQCTGFGQAGPHPCLQDVEQASSLDRAEETDMASGYETPTECMFDPFAPGPKEHASAPKKTLSTHDRLPLRRQLKFDPPSDDFEGMHNSEADDSAKDDKIAEVLHLSLLEVIMKSRLEEGSLTGSITSDEPATPTAACLLPGISDTCPGAPLRHTLLKSRKIDATICRKLDFSEDI